jgi:hypothetical protein
MTTVVHMPTRRNKTRPAAPTEQPARPYRLECRHGSYTITLYSAYTHPHTAMRAAAERLSRGATEVHLFDAVTRELLGEGQREGLSIVMRQGRNLAKTIQHEVPLIWHRPERSTKPEKKAAEA